MYCVMPAFVIDVEGQQLPHPNGAQWYRIAVRPDMARDLYLSLRAHFDPEDQGNE